MEKKNRLPEKWSLKYIKGHPCNDRVFEVLEILDPERVLHWKEWISENCKSGEFINYSKSSGVIVRSESKHPEIGANEFVSLTEEKEEWKPKRGERIRVSFSPLIPGNEGLIKTFAEMRGGRFMCKYSKTNEPNTDEENLIPWTYAKPIEHPKEVSFVPKQGETINVSVFNNPNDTVKRVFFAMDGTKFVCKKEHNDNQYSSWDYAWPVNNKLRESVLKQKIADHQPGGKVVIRIYEVIDLT